MTGKKVFTLLALLVALGFPSASISETIEIDITPEKMQGVVVTMINVVDDVATNLTEDGSAIRTLAGIAWRTLAMILLVWSIVNWMWLKKDLLDLFLALLMIFLTGAMIYILREGVPFFVWLATAFSSAFIKLSSLLFYESVGASGLGKSLWDAVGFMMGMVYKIDFDISGFDGFTGALAILVVKVAFILMAATTYIVTLMAVFGVGMLTIIGLLFVPMLMLPFGAQLFFTWLRSFLGFLFTLIFIGLILALVMFGVLEFLGVPANLIDDSYWDANTVIVLKATSASRLMTAAIIPLIGLVAMLQAFSWGSMLAGAGVPTGGGMKAVFAARMLRIG